MAYFPSSFNLPVPIYPEFNRFDIQGDCIERQITIINMRRYFILRLFKRVVREATEGLELVGEISFSRMKILSKNPDTPIPFDLLWRALRKEITKEQRSNTRTIEINLRFFPRSLDAKRRRTLGGSFY